MVDAKTYPQFYRKDGRCLKRETDMTCMEVQIPNNGERLPLILNPVTFPSKARLDEEVAAMQHVDQETYEQFITAFYQACSRNAREVWYPYRENKRAKAFELSQSK